MNLHSPFSEVGASGVHERSRERFLRAALLSSAGRADEADAEFRVLLNRAAARLAQLESEAASEATR